MKRVKQYRIRLTEQEDELLKQKARETGLSVADIIRLGVKYQIEKLEAVKEIELWKSSQFIKNWEQNFDSSLFQEFAKRWQDALKRAYMQTLKKYKDSVRYTDGKFEVLSSLVEVEEGDDSTAVEEEAEPETLAEREVKEDVCHCLATLLGGEWSGDEWIVQTFIAGLKVDLADSLV
ncbi:MAG TPA: ribbon-helix-helix protein, CopG family [Leptolyngbyaceae cyanobacterium]